MGDDWTAFVAYDLSLARSDQAKAAGQLFRQAGTPCIPSDELQQITVPVAPVWGRNDRALRLRIAERASGQYDWPLHASKTPLTTPLATSPRPSWPALRSALPER